MQRMSEAVYHVRAVPLPDGDAPVDLWVAGGRLTFVPQAGAEPLGPERGFALAGLVDCHVHLSLDPGRTGLPPASSELIARNRRTNRDCGVLLARDMGTVNEATIALARDGEAPRLHPAGRFLAPEGGYSGAQRATPGAELAQLAAAHAAAGARWVKVIGDWPRGGSGERLPALHEGVANYDTAPLAQAVAAAHAAGARLAVHAVTRAGIAPAVEAGVDSIEHALDADEELVRQMAARGIAWTPTLASFQATLRSAERRGQGDLAAWLRERFERLQHLLPLARRLGITVLAGTDVLPPGTVAREVAALQRSGLPPREALAAASSAARAFLGEPDLVEGAPADLVIYAADPRDDPEVLASPTVIMAGGELVRA